MAHPRIHLELRCDQSLGPWAQQMRRGRGAVLAAGEKAAGARAGRPRLRTGCLGPGAGCAAWTGGAGCVGLCAGCWRCGTACSGWGPGRAEADPVWGAEAAAATGGAA